MPRAGVTQALTDRTIRRSHDPQIEEGNHELPRTTKLYDRKNDVSNLDEIERILILNNFFHERELPMADEFTIADPSDCVFVERTLTQTPDRADLGYPDEREFLVCRETSEVSLVYYVATDDCPLEEYLAEYQTPIDAYKAANPTIPVREETVHHRKGIRWDPNQRMRC